MIIIKDEPQEHETPIPTNPNSKSIMQLPRISPKKPRTQALTLEEQRSSFKPESIVPICAKSLSNHLNRQTARHAKLCKICLDPVCDGVVVKFCGHTFCEKCWVAWREMQHAQQRCQCKGQQEQDNMPCERLLREGKLPCPRCWTMVKAISGSVLRPRGVIARSEEVPVFKNECCDLKDVLDGTDH